MDKVSVTKNLLEDKPDALLVDANSAPTDLAVSGSVAMFERLARDESVDVEKLQRLIDMQKDILRHQAEADFWAAFAEMQGDLPTIDEDGQIVVDGKVRSRYSTNEHIQEIIRPILKRHGFAISFRNTTNEKGLIKVTGILAHRSGHKESDSFDSMPDSGGSMNSIQRIGSTRSYGARYTTISLCNIVSRAKLDRDDDGKRAGKQEVPPPPDTPSGSTLTYEDWLKGLSIAAAKGLASFDPAWECSEPVYKTYLHKHDYESLRKLKETARVSRPYGKPAVKP